MSIQFETQRLLSEDTENRVAFVIKNDELDEMLKTYFSQDIDSIDHNKYYLDADKYEEFSNLAVSSMYEYEYDYEKIENIDEEGSTSSGAGAYLPSLHATPKKYKGPELKESEDKEPKLAAGKAKVYMKKKWGWKEAPSIPNRKSKMIDYKQLFERQQTKGVDKNGDEIKIGDEVKVLLYKDDGRGEVSGFEDNKVLVNVTKGGGSSYMRPNMPMFPANIEKIKKDKDDKKKEEEKEDSLQESYAKFRKETKTRSKSQQFHEAAKLIDKKLKEVNKILEYTNRLKSEIFEDGHCEDCGRRTNKVMEKITKNIAEAYMKAKKMK